MVSDRSNGIYRSVIAALVGLILVGNAQAQPISNSARSDATAAKSNQKATQHSDIAFGISRIGNQLEAQNAKADPYEKERNEREIRDLQAQEKSAYWAGAMFWATLGALVLSVIGVGLVWTTFRETRKANSIARETMFRQLRAYVTAESAERNHDNRFEGYSGLECVSITLHNSGATPATGVKVIYDRMEIIDGVVVKTANKVELPDIGAQARQSIVVGFHRWQQFQTAGLDVEKTISGQVFFYPVVPDEDGESPEIVVNFSLEIFDAINKGDLRVAITSLPHKTNF